MTRLMMMKTAGLHMSICLLACFCVLSRTTFADPPPGYPFLPYDEAIEQAKQQNKKVFLYYGRYGCGYCDKTNKESFSDPALRKAYTEHYMLAYVDAESGRRLTLPNGERITEMEFGARLKAIVTPVFIFLEPDGKPITKVPGFQRVADFVHYDRYIYQGYYKSLSLTEFLGQYP
jgi:thioredoxin-related protein